MSTDIEVAQRRKRIDSLRLIIRKLEAQAARAKAELKRLEVPKVPKVSKSFEPAKTKPFVGKTLGVTTKPKV